MNKFKIGDSVISVGFIRSGEIGEIYDCVKVDMKYDLFRDGKKMKILYKVRFNPSHSYIFWEDEIKLIDKGKREKRKEELRLKHIDIDPFGEENWEE